MEDHQIINLYWVRSEDAISETAKRYGKYCHAIAYNILHSQEDSEECVNDTYLNAWNAIPPKRPNKLIAFLGKITRNLALNRWEQYTAEKRGAGKVHIALNELHDYIPGTDDIEKATDNLVVIDVFNRFLKSLSPEARKIFMRRYWYMSSITEIALDYSLSEGKVKMSLHRSRKALKKALEKESILL